MALNSRRINLSDVRASLNAKVKGHWAEAWFGRPVGNLLTPAFYNTGWTANQVTMFRMVLALGGLATFFLPIVWSGAIAATIFYTCFILDFVDGNLARLRSEVTYWGKFVDGLADFIFVIGGPAAAGVAAWWHVDDAKIMLIGLLTALIAMTSQMVRNRLSFMREWMVSSTGPIENETMQRILPLRNLQAQMGSVYVNGTFLAPLALLLPDGGYAVYLWLLVGVQLVPEGIWTVLTISEASILLRRSRKSVHAA